MSEVLEVVNEIEYRYIEGYPGYRIGNDGSIWRRWVNCRWGRRLTDTWRRMKTPLNSRGYPNVNLVPPEGGSYKTFRVHRLVLTAFVGYCPEGMECRHLNGIKTDNRLENLIWGTAEENREDNRKLGAYGKYSTKYTFNGKTMCIKDWARYLNVPYATLYQRIKLGGMSFEEATSRPFLGTKSNGAHWTKIKREKGQHI